MIKISLLISFAEFTESLRLTEVRIPNHVIRNNSVRLECYFDMGNEALYSVKWYKDGYEFYRYVPRDQPPAQVFDQNGVTVNVSFLLRFQLNGLNDPLDVLLSLSPLVKQLNRHSGGAGECQLGLNGTVSL